MQLLHGHHLIIALPSWSVPSYVEDMDPRSDLRAEHGHRFRELHERDHPFVVPNPWDAGSARLLAGAGFEALATTSAGLASSLGVPDGTITLDDTVGNVAAIVSASDLPVTADLENGYGDDPDRVAAAITAVADAGAVGASIEDLAGRGLGLYERGHAAARVAAAVEAARALPFDFVVTARSEGRGTGEADLDETISRLQAYQEVGADVLYAPGLRSRGEIRDVVRAVDRPVNVVMGLGGPTFTVAELAELGVRRISVGSAMARLAYGTVLRAADEVRQHGTFGFAADAVPYSTMTRLLAPRIEVA
jgi:2-methylisocitrate lyase-like PEP mutase family enzyme